MLLGNIFKKKQPVETKKEYIFVGDVMNNLNNQQNKQLVYAEPWTIAKARLENGNKDYGYSQSIKLYNEHKVKLGNQWQNAFQNINAGYGTANLTFYNYQVVDYVECGFLAQDPLMNNVFNILSSIPFSKGGSIKHENTQLIKELEDKIKEFKIYKELEKAIKATLIFGGCLIFKDFGLTNLTQKLTYSKGMSLKRFVYVEPVNIAPLNVNSAEVLKADYMEPEYYNVVGMGTVHKSHFIKLQYNEPPKFLKPLCLYFGMPLTQLIKQDVANTNIISQGIANIVNKVRRTYMKMDTDKFTSDNAGQLVSRFNLMQQFENNNSIFPIDLSEDVVQLTMSLQGMPECLETAYECLSSKTGIPVNKLNGKSTGGLNASTSQIESDKNFIDVINSLRESLIKPALLQMLNCFTDEKLDYEFGNLTSETEQEKADTINKNLDSATKMSDGDFFTKKSIANWLKNNKANGMSELEVSTEDIQDDTFIEDVV